MHTGISYSAKEVLYWTRKDLLFLATISAIPSILYKVFDLKYLALPWLPIALIGTAVAFMVGFKNNSAYDRAWEARRIWGSILNFSRTFGIMTRDYVSNHHAKNALSEKELHQIHLDIINRHFAWLTALRYQLREPRQWESMQRSYNVEYKDSKFSVSEHNILVGDALKPYLSDIEFEQIMAKSNKAAQIIALQSAHIKTLLENGLIEDFRHMELEKLLAEFYNQQGASERIKNFPYPRQFATMSLWFIKIFICLIPFGMLQEFAKLGENMVWLTIPFGALSSWIFTTMEKIGESTENPFEGSPNDTPITAISRTIEIDLLEILNEPHQLKPLQAQNNILI